MVVKYVGLNQNEVARLVNEACKELEITSDLNIAFMETDYNEKLLGEENILSTVSLIFSIIAIVISFLGLFSYLSFVINQKKKDFSIRKVLGAEMANNLSYILKSQLTMVLIATITSMPIAFYFLSQWIDQFVYKLNISFVHLLLPVFTVLGILLVVVWVFSMLTDRMNPLHNLKDD